jgi:hypothetical protein
MRQTKIIFMNFYNFYTAATESESFWISNEVVVFLRVNLKGQCDEMVIEMSPWSSILGLN